MKWLDSSTIPREFFRCEAVLALVGAGFQAHQAQQAGNEKLMKLTTKLVILSSAAAILRDHYGQAIGGWHRITFGVISEKTRIRNVTTRVAAPAPIPCRRIARW